MVPPFWLVNVAAHGRQPLLPVTLPGTDSRTVYTCAMPDGTLAGARRRRKPREKFGQRCERGGICVDVDTLRGAKVGSEEGKDVLFEFSWEEDEVGIVGGRRESMI